MDKQFYEYSNLLGYPIVNEVTYPHCPMGEEDPDVFLVYAENEKGEGRLYDFSEINIDNLIKELIQDIESDLTGWSMFYCDCWGMTRKKLR